jgi:hypothetical protein
MQARFMIFRALEEAIKKEHDTVSWIKIVDSCLQQVNIESISKVSISKCLYQFVIYHTVNHF